MTLADYHQERRQRSRERVERFLEWSRSAPETDHREWVRSIPEIPTDNDFRIYREETQ